MARPAPVDIIADLVDRCLAFVVQVYLPDVLAIGSFYKDYFEIGAANPICRPGGDTRALVSGVLPDQMS